MHRKVPTLVTFIMSLLFWTAGDADAQRRARTIGGPKQETTKPEKKPGNQDKLKSFEELIKDRVVVEGLFTFYQDTSDNSVLMEIRPEQIGPIYLCGETRSGSEGAIYDAGAMGRSFPFYLRRVGKRILMLEKNVRFRADSSSTLSRAIERGVSDHLYGATDIKSKPRDSGDAVLVDPSDFFIRDAQHVAYFVGTERKMGFTFDEKNSYFELVRSFPENSEIDVKLHYKTSKPFSHTAMQNPYSMFHTFHYSLSTLPGTDYVPRIADDRMGHFLTLYQDYNDLVRETPYVRYIERWHLKKKNPEARVSEPVEPIVFWVENTVPAEYRDAVAEGIEFWNASFEKIGFRNAIIARQMSDTAEWDPADVRYNTVRWIVKPNAVYAVGPSRANPFTGQIYDADVRVPAEFIRYVANRVEYYVEPLTFHGTINGRSWSAVEPESEAVEWSTDPRRCDHAYESAQEASWGLSCLLATVGPEVDEDSLLKEYLHAYIVDLVAHEIGHTLGFRHNFKASTVYTLDQINDPDFTRRHGLTGTIMDYSPPNIAGPKKKQGEFYASVPGPYDDLMVAYAYSDIGAGTPEAELPRLRQMAAEAARPELAYGTDEDAFGNSPKGIDPLCNLFDLGSDPIAYCGHKIDLTNELWRNSLHRFEEEGEGYQRVLRAFQRGWRAYEETASLAAKYIGGIYHHRDHVGDPGGRPPFVPVPASQQRRAMQFLKENLFASDAFHLPAAVLNRLQPERFPDFNYSVYRMSQVDYPLHQYALKVQNAALAMLYSPHILGRLVNNLERYQPDEDRYTMYDMFNDVRQAIWSEAWTDENVNSFRRQLQLQHLNRVIDIYLSQDGTLPYDALTLAANDLEILEEASEKAGQSSSVDGMTRAHYKEVIRQIVAAKGARRDFAAEKKK